MSRPIAIVGPTATGKSDLGIALAEKLGGEVVNTDASQLYRGMDIGTAKVTTAERAAVPHHLLDVLELTETASVAAYQRHARRIVEEIQAAGKVPILVGGSGLYVQAVLDDLEFPGTDPQIRSRLEQELETVGAPLMHERLAALDSIAAGAILPTNGRRVVRALEVIELTGRPFSATMPKPGPARYGTVLIGLDREPAELDARIDARVTRMFAAGFVDEVRELEKLGLRDGLTASRALGYQQVLAAFDGEYDLDEAARLTAQGHRRFVRRQRSWFRRDKRITWLDAGAEDLLDEVLRIVTP
ncbi:tRNA (adenosine(37)-N6)-dimethylallyltransferase MiaA [Kibdelosporangium philippinense]|uniref:tRNA dimethylallyltransferase n=1 Tax=Kibdelosporangium philippinense TaxID=211113 RepID=A0ABS8ZQP9_9PSEU|nr:tRNA (adenosine(37)-N6)-dimethylallyltransferase MiaA [Kibdelosporangium philippinense]MCE7009523.1 tRNA (adenosine(37)-N6)-dimethylallyltransferase MiaA [Kibdelosporangium philippinense]